MANKLIQAIEMGYPNDGNQSAQSLPAWAMSEKLYGQRFYYNEIIKMGGEFGQLAKIRGIIYYKLSPHEQRAFAGYFSHSFFNAFRRIRSNVFRVLPPFVMSYAIYDWGEKKHAELLRKNPKDFENDV